MFRICLFSFLLLASPEKDLCPFRHKFLKSRPTYDERVISPDNTVTLQCKAEHCNTVQQTVSHTVMLSELSGCLQGFTFSLLCLFSCCRMIIGTSQPKSRHPVAFFVVSALRANCHLWLVATSICIATLRFLQNLGLALLSLPNI